MQDPERIVHAIAAHAKWKFYLRQAIETGKSKWTVAEVWPDDRSRPNVFATSVCCCLPSSLIMVCPSQASGSFISCKVFDLG